MDSLSTKKGLYMNRRYAKEEKLKYVLLLKEGKLDLSLTPEGGLARRLLQQREELGEGLRQVRRGWAGKESGPDALKSRAEKAFATGKAKQAGGKPARPSSDTSGPRART